VRLVEADPLIPTIDTRDIGAKLDELRNAHFINPVRLVEANPLILEKDIGNIKDKLAALQNAGFDAVRVVEKLPLILNYDVVRVRQVAGIVANFIDRKDDQIGLLIQQPPKVIDAVEKGQKEGQFQTFADVWEMIQRQKKE
jgi:hypothetical protein